jgi:hypothetical protein
MSDDLVARLRHAWDERERQLGEDEEVARGLLGATRVIGKSPNFYSAGGPAAESYWDHFMPVRVLAEVERGRRDIAAKRRILDDHEPLVNRACDRCSNGMYSDSHQIWPCTTVRLLAEAEGLA